MRVLFLKPYDFRPKEDHRVTIAYPMGFEGKVRKDCATAAISGGYAILKGDTNATNNNSGANAPPRDPSTTCDQL
jgi:hypothetical protein